MAEERRRTVTIQAQLGGLESLVPGRPPDPCSLVIFGATGDLTSRKLIPALYRLERKRQLPDGFAVIGFARRELSDDGFRELLEEGAKEHLPRGYYDRELWTRFARRIHFVRGTFENPEAFVDLRVRLGTLDQERQTGDNRLFYLATPPSDFPVILGQLRAAGLVSPADGRFGGGWTRVVIEKPFGRDLATAIELHRQAREVLAESQIYRIDHYLGKETVQNILVFRFGNAIFEPLWNRKSIDHVQITAAESVDVEDRGAFYDETGVIRDLVQNHLLQVLALFAMEPPVSFRADDIRSQTVQVLGALRPLRGDAVKENVVVGQYAGYQDARGVARGSRTATYSALCAHIDNWRWQGVPIYIRTGKALTSKVTEVAVTFQSIPLCLFGEEACLRVDRNTLVLRIQPDEGISIGFSSKVPGDELRVGSVQMDFSYAEAFGIDAPEAYQRLLLDCMRGDQTLFIRGDAVLRSWEWITPILEVLESERAEAPAIYERGTAGPEGADRLIARDGRRWRKLR